MDQELPENVVRKINQIGGVVQKEGSVEYTEDRMRELAAKSEHIMVEAVDALRVATADTNEFVIAMAIHAAGIWGMMLACAKPEEVHNLKAMFDEMSTQAATKCKEQLDQMLINKLKGFPG